MKSNKRIDQVINEWEILKISDDEDETHPNIDTPSLFRWRHQARVERMAESEKEKEDMKKKRQSFQARLIDVKERIAKKEGDEAALKVYTHRETQSKIAMVYSPLLILS